MAPTSDVLPNKRLERSGAPAGLRIERLEDSKSRSFDQAVCLASVSARRSTAGR
jgi:hypothetical protein